MGEKTIRYSFFEITWVIIACLLVAIYFLLVEIHIFEDKVAELENELAKFEEVPQNPPYIVLSESEAVFRFESGSYELSPEFRSALEVTVVPLIDALATAYKCDVLQVIGHTDGIGMKSKLSSVDYTIMPFMNGGELDVQPMPGSNIDLGMLRAITVTNFLRQRLGLMPGVKHVLPYSAGPIIATDGTVRPEAEGFEDEASRRVELRLTVLGKQSDSVR